MSNVLASVRFTVDVSEEKAERLVGRPDDGSDAWYSEACAAVEKAIDDDPLPYLESCAPPDVEVD